MLGTHKTLLALRPRVCEKIQAHTLPVPLLPQLRPNFTVFIVKCVVGGGFAVVVIIFLGTRKGLIPLAALSDVLMIYRHSLGKAGILLPGSLKKLCTGSLCSAGLGDGGKRAIGARGSGGSSLHPGPAAPLSPSRSWVNVQLPLEAQPVWSYTRAQSPSQGLQLLSWTSLLCVYILTSTESQCFRVLAVWGFCLGFWGFFCVDVAVACLRTLVAAASPSYTFLVLGMVWENSLAPCEGGWCQKGAGKGQQTDKGSFESTGSVSQRGDGSGAADAWHKAQALTEPQLLSLAQGSRSEQGDPARLPGFVLPEDQSDPCEHRFGKEGPRSRQRGSQPAGDPCLAVHHGVRGYHSPAVGSEPGSALGNLPLVCPGASERVPFVQGLSRPVPCHVLLQSLLSRGRFLPFASSPEGIFGAGVGCAWQSPVHSSTSIVRMATGPGERAPSPGLAHPGLPWPLSGWVRAVLPEDSS